MAILVYNIQQTQKILYFYSVCMLLLCALRVFVVICVCLCIGHLVMVPLNFAFLHCLQHSFFEHIFNLYLYMVTVGIMISINS